MYEPYDGDYPDYNITGTNDNAKLFGDQTLWWVFNDKGNIHTETEAQPLGLEIHAQAFEKDRIMNKHVLHVLGSVGSLPNARLLYHVLRHLRHRRTKSGDSLSGSWDPVHH